MENRVLIAPAMPALAFGLGLLVAGLYSASADPVEVEPPIAVELADVSASPPISFVTPMIAGSYPRLPAPFAAAHHGELVRGVYKVCVAPEGWVDTVEPLVSISPSVDVALEQQIWTTWRHVPQTLSICYAKPLAYAIPE